MSPYSILLKVLLSFSLVLNGTGYAMASVGMAAGEILHSEAMEPGANSIVAAESAIASADCHGQEASSNAVPPHQLSIEAGGPQPLEHEHTSTDCCPSDLCSCACMQLVHAVTAALIHQSGAALHMQAVAFKQSTHASPVIPHLTRPPIA